MSLHQSCDMWGMAPGVQAVTRPAPHPERGAPAEAGARRPRPLLGPGISRSAAPTPVCGPPSRGVAPPPPCGAPLLRARAGGNLARRVACR